MKAMKKVVAVLMVAVMTMAMSVLAFADEEVTFHFKNVKNWENVGGWIYEGTAFTTNVTPADKCAVVNGDKQLWPGAKCEDEGNGWVKVTAKFTSRDAGAVVIFNNWVADNTINDTTTQEDLDKLAASGVLCDSSAKEQSPNIMIGIPRDGYVAFDASEYWISWDGASTAMIAADGSGLSKEAPADYTVGGAETPSDDQTQAPADDQTQAPADNQTQAPADNQTQAPADNQTQAPTTAAPQKAPTTGDSVAMTVVLFGLVAAVAFVVSKKKVNA